MQLVPDKLRQDRVFAISPGLSLVSVSTLPRDTSVSVACRDEARGRGRTQCWPVGKERPPYRSAHSIWLRQLRLAAKRDTMLPLSNLWSSKLGKPSQNARGPPVSLGTRPAPKQRSTCSHSGSLTASCGMSGTALLSSMSSGSSTAYPLRTNSNPISSF